VVRASVNSYKIRQGIAVTFVLSRFKFPRNENGLQVSDLPQFLFFDRIAGTAFLFLKRN